LKNNCKPISFIPILHRLRTSRIYLNMVDTFILLVNLNTTIGIMLHIYWCLVNTNNNKIRIICIKIVQPNIKKVEVNLSHKYKNKICVVIHLYIQFSQIIKLKFGSRSVFSFILFTNCINFFFSVVFLEFKPCDSIFKLSEMFRIGSLFQLIQIHLDV